MKVFLQTRLTPPVMIYDTEAPEGYGKAVLKLLKPVVAVTDGRGNVYYKTGEFYPSVWPYIKYGAMILAGYFIIRRYL